MWAQQTEVFSLLQAEKEKNEKKKGNSYLTRVLITSDMMIKTIGFMPQHIQTVFLFQKIWEKAGNLLTMDFT